MPDQTAVIIWSLPIKTISEANRSEHWKKSSKRHKQQQFFIRSMFLREAREIPMPCIVKMVRLSSRFLDEDDNLRMAFKWIKDEIADCMFPDKIKTYIDKNGITRQLKGRNDDTPLIKWQYAQEKCSISLIRIEIYPLDISVLPNTDHAEIL